MILAISFLPEYPISTSDVKGIYALEPEGDIPFQIFWFNAFAVAYAARLLDITPQAVHKFLKMRAQHFNCS